MVEEWMGWLLGLEMVEKDVGYGQHHRVVLFRRNIVQHLKKIY
jgi:hypothetical protein